MKAPTQTIEFADTWSVRDIEQREITGRIVPFGETITVSGRRERFTPGVFADVQADDVALLMNHDRTDLRGRAVALEEREDGVHAVFKIARTQAGDELLALAQDRMLRGLSVGFRPRKSALVRDDGGDVIEYKSADLPEVSATAFPAYKGGEITSVRETDETTEEGATMPETETAPAATVETRVTDEKIEERFDSFATQLEDLRGRIPAVTTETRQVTPEEWFTAELRAVQGDDTMKRAIADVVGTTGGTGDASGLMPQYWWAGGLVNVLDDRMPLFAHAGSMPFPTHGTKLALPVVKSGPSVAKGAQKAAASSTAMVVDTEAFEANWFKGALDVSMELIQQSDPAVMAVVYDRLRGLWQIEAEKDIVAQTETAATASGATLKTTSYKDLVTDIVTQGQAIRTATGAFGNMLAVTAAEWVAILALVDGTDRRQFATIGGMNQDGSAGLTGLSINIGGVTVFEAGVTNAVQFNTDSLKAAQSGPRRVSVVDVEKMGINVGIIGASIVAPVIAAGIVAYKA